MDVAGNDCGVNVAVIRLFHRHGFPLATKPVVGPGNVVARIDDLVVERYFFHAVRIGDLATEEAGDVLALETNGNPVLLIIEEPLQNVQIDLRINLDDFDGAVSVVHNFQDAENYMFMKLAKGKMQQGTQQGGTTTVHDEKPFEAQGWQQLRVVADRTHFRAYGAQRMVTHGHGAAAQEGTIGFRLEGAGTVLLDNIHAQMIAH